jgi:hypothetical protein
MWKKSTAVVKNYVTGASKSRAIGAVCIGLAVGLVCNHLGVTGWKLHAIPTHDVRLLYAYSGT